MARNQDSRRSRSDSTKSELLKDLTIAVVGGSSAPIIEFSLSKIPEKTTSEPSDSPQSINKRFKEPSFNTSIGLDNVVPNASIENLPSDSPSITTYSRSIGITTMGLLIGLLIAISIFTFRRVHRRSEVTVK